VARDIPPNSWAWQGLHVQGGREILAPCGFLQCLQPLGISQPECWNTGNFAQASLNITPVSSRNHCQRLRLPGQQHLRRRRKLCSEKWRVCRENPVLSANSAEILTNRPDEFIWPVNLQGRILGEKKQRGRLPTRIWLSASIASFYDLASRTPTRSQAQRNITRTQNRILPNGNLTRLSAKSIQLCMRARTWFQPWFSRPGWPSLRIVRMLPRAVLSRPSQLIQHRKRRNSSRVVLLQSKRFQIGDFTASDSPNALSQKPLPVFYLAMAHEAMGDATQALDLYQQAENLSPEKSPQSAEILVAYGRFLLTLGRTQDGIEKIRRAIQDDPRVPRSAL
jgi:hypothetical protein